MLLTCKHTFAGLYNYKRTNRFWCIYFAQSTISFSFDFAVGADDTLRVRFQGVRNIAIADVTILIEI